MVKVGSGEGVIVAVGDGVFVTVIVGVKVGGFVSVEVAVLVGVGVAVLICVSMDRIVLLGLSVGVADLFLRLAACRTLPGKAISIDKWLKWILPISFHTFCSISNHQIYWFQPIYRNHHQKNSGKSHQIPNFSKWRWWVRTAPPTAGSGNPGRQSPAGELHALPKTC